MLGRQPGHGYRDQVLDGLKVARSEAAPAVHVQGHGRARRDPLAAQQVLPGQDQVHPGGADVGQRGDGAGELPSSAAAQLDAGRKVDGAEGALPVEDPGGGGAAPGQSFLGERHAQARRLSGGDEDCAPVLPLAEGNAERLEPADDRGGVLPRQIPVEQGVVRLGNTQQQGDEQPEQTEGDRAEDDQPPGAEPSPRRARPAKGRGLIRLGAGGLVGCRQDRG